MRRRSSNKKYKNLRRSPTTRKNLFPSNFIKKYVKDLFKDSSGEFNIKYVGICTYKPDESTVNDRMFICIGEHHSNAVTKSPFVSFVQHLCDTDHKLDLFIETTHTQKERYKHRLETIDELDKELYQTDSMEQSRSVARANCANYRVHPIDIRDEGMKYFVTQMSDNLLNSSISQEAIDDMINCFRISLNTTRHYAKVFTESSTRKCISGLQDLIQQHTRTIDDFSWKVYTKQDLQRGDIPYSPPFTKQAVRRGALEIYKIWEANARLVDMYLLARMLRADNHKICVFYGGSSHARDIMSTMSKWDKFEVEIVLDREERYSHDQQILKRWSTKAKTMTIPKGTKLYGTYPSSCDDLEARYDQETGKTGKYFSTGMYIPLGMILEYNKPAKLCTYQLLEDTQFFVGKYSFRQIEALRYYKSSKDAPIGKSKRDNFVLNTDPEKSYNHIDASLLPIHELFEGNNFNLWEGKEAEVFLTANSLKNIRPVGNGEEVSVSKAREMVESRLQQL